jgi:hypothetical protein
MISGGITYCCHDECNNTECYRHTIHAPKDRPVSYADMDDGCYNSTNNKKEKEEREKILDIKECFNIGDKDMDGYLLETNKKLYYFLIYNYRPCRGKFGYMSTLDNYKGFIGAAINDINYTPDEKACKINLNNLDFSIAGDYIIVVVETNRGSFQLGIYNKHDGCDKHRIQVFSVNKEIQQGDE